MSFSLTMSAADAGLFGLAQPSFTHGEIRGIVRAVRQDQKALEPASSERSDEALMQAYQRGDDAAFSALFSRYARRIYGYFAHRSGSRAHAEDMTQQTWLQVHRARASYRGDGRFAPWLFTIAANTFRTTLRGGAAIGGRERLTSDGATPEPLWAEPGLTEDQRAVRQALAALPDAYREVILLHRWEGLGFAEIAAILGQNESAVKVRAHRGYLKLREILADGERGASQKNADSAKQSGAPSIEENEP